ncbi:MAG: hypothetical protein FD138_509 [Planctomycetota bacterium]|nr:MAG: hypothetical protein FD138_509 [Planctomycetota bacterium]
MLRFVALVIAVVLSSSSAWADVASGPGEGNVVEKFKVTVVAGESSGKELDFVTERKEKPTVFVFVSADKFSRPMARFIKVLDDKLKAERTDVDIVAVWLTDDVTKSKDYLPKAFESLKTSRTAWSVFAGEKTGPNNWGINPDADITVVVSDGAKAKFSKGYRSINETEVPKVFETLPAKK